MIKNIATLLTIAAFSAILSNCYSLSKKECSVADWKSIGYTDGLQGYSTSRIENHRESCARVGVTPNLDLYRAGHKQGIKGFCTPAKGFDYGKSGKTYNNVCTGKEEQRFLDLYHMGKEINRLESELSKIRSDQSEAYAELDADELTKEARRRLRREIDRKGDEMDRIKGQISDLEIEAQLLMSRY